MRILEQLDSFRPYSSGGCVRLLLMEDLTYLIGFDLPEEGIIDDNPCMGDYARYEFKSQKEALSHWKQELISYFLSNGYYGLSKNEAIKQANNTIAMLKDRS